MAGKLTWLDRSMKLRAAALRRLVDMLMSTRHSNHSGQGATLGPLVRHLETEGQPYRLTAHPGKGYYLELVEDPFGLDPTR